ncbi:hypothetical protein [Roseateles toxinivorans]|uniref:hypothetical protein n=1 Tax=Roseateles toxinivorans TaxID=270368 RepID=UPI001414E5BF|nr:hypothetical protein [Roseateles toxinivorans]
MRVLAEVANAMPAVTTVVYRRSVPAMAVTNDRRQVFGARLAGPNRRPVSAAALR